MNLPITTTYAQRPEILPDDVSDRLAIEFLLSKLSPFEQDILLLYNVDELTFSQIGLVLGHKYRDKEFTGSAIRYHYEKIKRKLGRYREALGM